MQKLPDFEGLAMFTKVAEQRSFAAAARAWAFRSQRSRGVSRGSKSASAPDCSIARPANWR
jgi:hypothetical protein